MNEKFDKANEFFNKNVLKCVNTNQLMKDLTKVELNYC